MPSTDVILLVVTLVLALANGLLGLDAPTFERRFARERETRLTREELVEKHYRPRPKAPLYAAAPDLALGRPVPNRRTRYVERARLVGTLPDARRDEVALAARQWTSTVGQFAREAAGVHELPLRRFLATYHLGVIREASVAIPVLMWLRSQGQLTRTEVENMEWGFALLNLAAFYNGTARQQREDVYFLARGHSAPIGPVLRAPHPWTRWLRDISDRCSVQMRLRRWRRWWSSRWLTRAMSQLN